MSGKRAVYTPETAKLHWCPYAGPHRQGETCLAEHCMAWRWHTMHINDPASPGGQMIRSSDTYGYCGLAGAP